MNRRSWVRAPLGSHLPRWLNWIERMTSNHKVVGSSPTRGIFAWLPERSKGVHLRCTVFNHSWVRTPHLVLKGYLQQFISWVRFSKKVSRPFINGDNIYPEISCSLVVMITRFHRVGPGSIPGRRTLKEQTANPYIINFPFIKKLLFV